MKNHQHNVGHMTMMAVMPIYGKKLLLFRNHWADFDENLYEASENLAVYILFKLLPWLTLTYLMAR